MNEITAVLSGHEVISGDHALVPWWSFTKTVLATTALVLVDQDRLHLDKAIEGQPFSLRHLLQHSAGLADYGHLPVYREAVASGMPAWSSDEMLDRAKADQLLFLPGQGWAYSNIGYFYVRTLIEQTTGVPLLESINRLVLQRLGISDVILAETADDLARSAWGNRANYDPRWVYHGLLLGSASSAALLLDRLMSGNILKPHTMQAMLTSHGLGGPFPGRPWQAGSYGLGVMSGVVNGERYVGHTGEGPGSVIAVYWKRPGQSVAVAQAGSTEGEVEHSAVRLLEPSTQHLG